MDYCSSCRRHLNGALVCPGCGAYAPDIAPITDHGRFVPASPATAVEAGLDEGSWQGPSVDPMGELPSSEGRAARRRQRARWRKSRRRAVVATAFALVGGGLTVSAMDRQGGERAQAATAPEEPGTGFGEEAAQNPRPTSIPPAPQDTAPTPSTQPAAPDLPRQQHSTASLRTTPPSTRPETAPAPPTTAKQAQQRQSGSPDTGPASSGTADTSPAQTQAPAAPHGTAGSGDGSADSEASQPSAAPTAPEAPTATRPSELCLLVVCLNL
ncbi:hypothetical protein ACFVZW_03020 [Streptomyces sp. NPDC059567]|uniref:SCO2400 family protein n=1 Tax=Streptomyces sp. NPDC059567 TaxID=3346867 RepID=UPI0036923083